jgi:Brp/Blh family beta-carotene 15,15'-monooxygenase
MRQFMFTYLPYCLPALLLLGMQAAFGTISFNTQLIILGVSLALTGIPHGALDYLVFQQQEIRAGRNYSLVRFLAYYLGLLAFYGVLWWVSPSISLMAFLLLSAWHFAETDLSALPLSGTPDHLIRLGWGIWLLLCLLFGHTQEVIPYLAQITSEDSVLVRFAQAYAVYATPVFWLGVVAWPMLLWLRVSRMAVTRQQWQPLITILLLLLLCRSLPLILSFTVYFSVWHSLRSFNSIWLYLRQQKSGKLPLWQTLKSALPFIGGAFAGLALFFMWSSANETSLTPLWVFLSLITLPHGLLMHAVFKQAGKKGTPALSSV